MRRLEETEAAKKVFRSKITHFQSLPTYMQVMQVGTTAMLVFTFYLLLGVPSRLFQPFALTDCPKQLGIAPYNFIPSMTFLGFLALVFFVSTGTIGFYACYWFVWKIFSAIKVD